jgi:hypothetical protein
VVDLQVSKPHFDLLALMLDCSNSGVPFNDRGSSSRTKKTFLASLFDCLVGEIGEQ